MNGHNHKQEPSQRQRSPSWPPPPVHTWATKNLRIRVISKDYKRGEYYKVKLIVIDADDKGGVTK